MAAFAFETMSASDAASFGADDYLFFVTSGATANNVVVTPYQNGGLGTGISLSYAGKTLTFPNTISAASFNNHIQFNDSSHLEIGTEGANGANVVTNGSNSSFTVPADGQPATAYGLGGDDTIDFSTTTARTANYLNGGFGADTINGGAGNNHIYGNSMTSQTGATDSNGNVDGGDTITVTSGSNYINGNGGADIIRVGVTATTQFTPGQNGGAATQGNASTGANRVFGGSGNDQITILGQGANAVNGNVGNDVINASASTGNNMLRGGADSDTITGGSGQTVMMGDNGADTLVAGTGTSTMLNDGSMTQKLSIMTGGAGNDTFNFGTAGNSATAGYAGSVDSTNSYVHSGVTINGGTYYQTITDFTQGQDTIHLSFSGTTAATAVDIVKGAASFTSVSAAEVYAQGLLANHTLTTSNGTPAGGEVAAIDVNGSTYLFYHAAGGETPANAGGTPGIDSIIQLTGVSSSTLSQQGSGVHTFS